MCPDKFIFPDAPEQYPGASSGESKVRGFALLALLWVQFFDGISASYVVLA